MIVCVRFAVSKVIFAIFAISELLSGREDKIENITIAVRPTKILQKKEEWMREKGYGTHKI